MTGYIDVARRKKWSDIDWWECEPRVEGEEKYFAFSWLGGLFRILDPTSEGVIAGRNFAVREGKYSVTGNYVPQGAMDAIDEVTR